jgi:predicted ester cyclase
MSKCLWILFVLFYIYGCNSNYDKEYKEHKILAEKFFRGVYSCNPSVVDSLAAENVFISYPIFERLYGTTAIQGREDVKNFVNNFCRHWTEAKFTIHKKIAEGSQVVLVWSFSARNTGSINGNPPSNKIVSWSGISVFSFNEQGKIVSEVGEESYNN